jgi:hypothetical protein
MYFVVLKLYSNKIIIEYRGKLNKNEKGGWVEIEDGAYCHKVHFIAEVSLD